MHTHTRQFWMVWAFLIGLSANAGAQTIPLYTQYNINPFVMNAAAAGLHSGHIINLSYRAQWNSFPTAPRTSLFTYSGQVKKSGFGLLAFNDRSGILQHSGLLGAYSYRLNITPASHLRIGFSMQYLQLRARAEDLVYEQVNMFDPLINEALQGYATLETSLGFHFAHDGGFYLGVAAPNLIDTKLSEDEAISSELGFLTANYFVYTGYKFGKKAVVFDPSVLVRRVPDAPFQVEVNARLWLADETLLIGTTYRTAEEALALTFGLHADNGFRLYYSYDYAFNDLSNYHYGSHEFTIGYHLGKVKAETAKFSRGKPRTGMEE